MIGIDYINTLGSDKDFFMASLAWNNKLTIDDFDVTYPSLYDNYFPANTQKIFSYSFGQKKRKLFIKVKGVSNDDLKRKQAEY